MAAFCFAIPLSSSSRSSNNAIPNESSIPDEEEVKREGEVKTGEGESDGDRVVSEAEPAVMKKPRPCELYVCNIPKSYDVAQLLEMFQTFGTVSRNPQTGESRGSGYITMGSINSAKMAIASLDAKEVGGREMRVRYSVDMNPGTRRNPQVWNNRKHESVT